MIRRPQWSPLPYFWASSWLSYPCWKAITGRFSRLVVFLLCSDVRTFSSVFNGLTVFSTVNMDGLHGPVSCHRRVWSRNPLSNLVVGSILPPDCTSRVSDHSFLSRSRLGHSSCCLRRQCAHGGITNRGCHAGVLGKGRDIQLRSSSVPLGLKFFPGTTSSQAH